MVHFHLKEKEGKRDVHKINEASGTLRVYY